MRGKNATERLSPDEQGIARAAQILRDGGLVAVPTETVYGLAARADSDEAVAKIYAAKGRPSFNPLIVHVGDTAQANILAQWDERATRMAEAFWPGPLTLVLPRRPDAGLATAVTAGLPTLALRCPAHPAMRAIIAAAQVPLAAPSANRSGFVSPTMAEHVFQTLDGRIDAVLDGGATARGLESSIVALRDIANGGGWQMLRPGPITREQIAEVIGDDREIAVAATAIEAPGQLASHYAPGKPLRLEAEQAVPGEFMIGFGTIPGDCTLSSAGDLEEAAARLYECLHLAAESEQARIAVAPIPDRGIGTAINDRLRRAAA
ncbi:L-threonylcarbamoyladenylate synthase [Altererythrobacter arenosus]|uniref:Threonylcarbamoyl-AMP synthase n=1 Tax=Altererythrobacter arenosus TaxID=3032592 RepID=A0ABY8FUJ3_9SPHN|nr:L-threonylcarbamoyladenylate synthase [Altererythrobacter sp. CAU 1644]WFL78674.1 L-threonylcarbamoyladenylate synthase [Altererythrobacter sp. CAU 1644]